MKHKILLNPDQICSIKTIIDRRKSWISYKPELKILGIIWRKEGYHNEHKLPGEGCWTEQEINNGTMSGDMSFFAQDKIVYYRPHIEIKMSNEDVFYQYFVDLKELSEFKQNYESLKNINWIKL